MKKILFLFLAILLPLCSLAQSKKYYCEIKGIEKDFSSGLKIVFDFGNNPVYSNWNVLNGKQKFVDQNGEEIPFYSMVDAGNYLSDKGWTFVQAYTSVYESKAIIHWIFVKEAESPEEAAFGIMTKDEYIKKNRK